jgi:hypothetical protein
LPICRSRITENRSLEKLLAFPTPGLQNQRLAFLEVTATAARPATAARVMAFSTILLKSDLTV